MQKGLWREYAIDYATESPMSIALFTTFAIIFYGIALVIRSKKVKE